MKEKEEILWKIFQLWEEGVHHIRARNFEERKEIIRRYLRSKLKVISLDVRGIPEGSKFEEEFFEELDKISYARHRGFREIGIADLEEYERILKNKKKFIKFIKKEKRRFPTLNEYIS